jgi:hypothetical protein
VPEHDRTWATRGIWNPRANMASANPSARTTPDLEGHPFLRELPSANSAMRIVDKDAPYLLRCLSRPRARWTVSQLGVGIAGSPLRINSWFSCASSAATRCRTVSVGTRSGTLPSGGYNLDK